MLKLACFLTGENFDLLSNDTPGSKKKVIALSLVMLLPVLIWIISGFLLPYQVLHSSIGIALLTSVVCGVIVFIIEKTIIMAKGNFWLALFRIGLGLIIALLGSIAIDEVAFKKEIDFSVKNLRDSSIEQAKVAAKIQFNNLNNYEEIEHKISEAQIKYDNAENATLAEADGSNGSKARGWGKITDLKNAKALDRKRELNNLQTQKAQLDSLRDIYVKEAGDKARANFEEDGLLIRIKALSLLVDENEDMRRMYLLFTVVLFFIEFIVVIVKCTWKKTNYEHRIEMMEEIGRRRIEHLLRPGSPIIDAGNHLQELQNARTALQRKHTLYN